MLAERRGTFHTLSGHKSQSVRGRNRLQARPRTQEGFERDVWPPPSRLHSSQAESSPSRLGSASRSSAICKVLSANLCSLVVSADGRCRCDAREMLATQKTLPRALRLPSPACSLSLLASRFTCCLGGFAQKFHSCVARETSQRRKPANARRIKEFMTISLRP